MVVSQERSKRTVTGSRYKQSKKKKKHEMGRVPSFTKIDELKARKMRVLGGNQKIRLIRTNIVNLLDKKTNKYAKAKITSVVGNPANRHFVRRNIMTKGCIIETDKGKARVTSRPGQDGIVNAVLI